MPASNPESGQSPQHISPEDRFQHSLKGSFVGYFLYPEDSEARAAAYRRLSSRPIKLDPTKSLYSTSLLTDEFFGDFESSGTDTNPDKIYHSKVCPPAPEGSYALAEQLLDRRPSTDPTSEE